MADRPINEAALVELVRQAMGSGVACFADRMAEGLVRRDAPLTEAFGDYPAEWVQLRRSLVDALLEPEEAS